MLWVSPESDPLKMTIALDGSDYRGRFAGALPNLKEYWRHIPPVKQEMSLLHIWSGLRVRRHGGVAGQTEWITDALSESLSQMAVRAVTTGQSDATDA